VVFLQRNLCNLRKMQNKCYIFELANATIWRVAKSEFQQHFFKDKPRSFPQSALTMGSRQTIDDAPPHLCSRMGGHSFFLRGLAT
jgi:hypothetical protein